MTLPKWLVALLMLVFNTAGGLAAMGLFKAGSGGAIACAVVGLVFGNALAVFGVPLAPTAKPAPVLTSVPKSE